jgi:hypothetical protein
MASNFHDRLMDRMGHSTAKTALIYLHSTDERSARSST